MALIKKARFAIVFGTSLSFMGVVMLLANFYFYWSREAILSKSSFIGPVLLTLGLAMILFPGRAGPVELGSGNGGDFLKEMWAKLPLSGKIIWALSALAGFTIAVYCRGWFLESGW